MSMFSAGNNQTVNIAEGANVVQGTQNVNISNDAPSTENLSSKSIWHWWNDSNFGKADEVELHRAGFYTNRVDNPTLDILQRDLTQYASDGNAPAIVHNSGHATEGFGYDDVGIQMSDGTFIVSEDLAELFKGHDIELFVLMSCSYVDIAEKFNARWIVAFHEELPNDDATKAVFHFYKSLKAGLSVEDSFETMTKTVPDIAPYARLFGVRNG